MTDCSHCGPGEWQTSLSDWCLYSWQTDASRQYRSQPTTSSDIYHVHTGWRRGAVGRVSDLRSRGRGFESRPGTRRKNSGQVSHTCVLLSPSSISWYRPKGGDALQLGSKGRYGLCGTVWVARKTVRSPCYTPAISERFRGAVRQSAIQIHVYFTLLPADRQEQCHG